MKRKILLYIAFLLAFNNLRAQQNQEEHLQLSAIDSIATKYIEKEDFQQALPYLLQLVDKKMKTNTIDTLLAENLNNIAFCYLNLGYTQKALYYSEEALSVIEKTLGKEHIEYANYLWNLSYTYSMAGESIKALEYGKKAFKQIWKEKADNLDYANYVLTLAGYNSDIGEKTEAINLTLEAKDIIEKNVGKIHPYYLTILDQLSNYYSATRQYDKSFLFASEEHEISCTLYGKEEIGYAKSLNSLALNNLELGNYENFFNQEREVLNIYENIEGRNTLAYATILANLAGAYSRQGKYAKAIQYQAESLTIKEPYMGKEHLDYQNEMMLLANWYKEIGNYQEAVRITTEILNSLEDKEDITRKYHYIKRLNDLGEIHLDFGHSNKALETHQKAFQLLVNLNGTNTPEYARSLTFLSYYLSNNNEDFKKALETEKEACLIYQTFHEKNSYHSEYILSLNKLSQYYFILNEKGKARALNKKAIKISKEVYGDNYSKMDQLLENSFLLSVKTKGEYPNWSKLQITKKSEKSFEELVNWETIRLKKNLSELTAKERAQYFKQFTNLFYKDIAALSIGSKRLILILYNSILFSRGLLLNSDIQIDKLIQESNDSTLLNTYYSFKSNKVNLKKLYATPVKDRKLKVDSLESVTENLEKILIQKSQAYGNYISKLETDYHDVQAALTDKDIAIEFIQFPIDSIWCITALILKKGMKVPEYKLLFTESKLEEIPPTDYYTTTRLYQLIWEPFQKYLKNVKNIYFVPDGILHNTAIEYLPVDGQTLMSDKYNLYRLSSTREVASKKERKVSNKAILFGGLEYDADFTDNNPASFDSAKIRLSDVSHDRTMGDSLSCRGGVQYLDGTEIEVENIANAMSKNKIPHQLFTNIAGTEEAFKQLSGGENNILHIATHGFYWNQQEVNLRQQKLSFLNYGNSENEGYAEERTLTRSGLLFSGANHILRNEYIPSNREDGVLTALELSQLDFRNLDLVVLSACQTGLGEIKGDGVFGLQRGFKKAGAQTLLMSLWKVNDEATQILMTEFYQYLSQGSKKYDAFIKAQQYLRIYQNGKYDKPEYWAAFIMLDGIN